MGRVGEGDLKELKFFLDQGLVLGVLHGSDASLQANRKQRSEGQTQILSLLFSHSQLITFNSEQNVPAFSSPCLLTTGVF